MKANGLSNPVFKKENALLSLKQRFFRYKLVVKFKKECKFFPKSGMSNLELTLHYIKQ